MKFNFSKRWKITLVSSVITLILGAMGVVLTPQQQAVILPVSESIVEFVTDDATEREQLDDALPDEPFIEDEEKPPRPGEETDIGKEMVKVVAEEATKSFIKNLFD